MHESFPAHSLVDEQRHQEFVIFLPSYDVGKVIVHSNFSFSRKLLCAFMNQLGVTADFIL